MMSGITGMEWDQRGAPGRAQPAPQTDRGTGTRFQHVGIGTRFQHVGVTPLPGSQDSPAARTARLARLVRFTATARLCQVRRLLSTLQLEELAFTVARTLGLGGAAAGTLALASQPCALTLGRKGGLCLVSAAGGLGAPTATWTLGPWV